MAKFMKIKILCYVALALCSLWASSGCTSPDRYVYLYDLQPDVSMNVQDPKPIKLQPGDKLRISVHSRDKELVDMFNVSGVAGEGGGSGVYTVDNNGRIEMPVLGSVHVKGLTRLELQNTLRYKLLASKLVRDPIVSVAFDDMGYYVIGEVSSGKQNINRDCITIIEALSEFGGIDLDSRRDQVVVLRTIDGQQTPYELDLTKTASVYSSPVYYLQQNDVIYIKPTDLKLDRTSPIGSAVRTPTFWISMFTVALSLGLYFVK